MYLGAHTNDTPILPGFVSMTLEHPSIENGGVEDGNVHIMVRSESCINGHPGSIAEVRIRVSEFRVLMATVNGNVARALLGRNEEAA